MVEILNAIITTGGTTAYSVPFTDARMLDEYVQIQPPQFHISCTVAILEQDKHEGRSPDIVGFQGLQWANPAYKDELDASWAIIATFVRQEYHGMGIGRSLFTTTLEAAKDAGVTKIDATIRSYNTGGQAYYDHMGFKTYRETDVSVSKRFDVGSVV